MTKHFSRNLGHISLSLQVREALDEDALHVVRDGLRPFDVRGVHAEVFQHRGGDVEGFVSQRADVVGCSVERHRPQVVHASLDAWVLRLHGEPEHHASCILRNRLLALALPRFREVLDERFARSNEQEDSPTEDSIFDLKGHKTSLKEHTVR